MRRSSGLPIYAPVWREGITWVHEKKSVGFYIYDTLSYLSIYRLKKFNFYLFDILIAYLRLIRMAGSLLLKSVLCGCLLQTRLRPWFLTGISRNIHQSIHTNNSMKAPQIITQQIPSTTTRVGCLLSQYQSNQYNSTCWNYCQG